MGTFLDRTRPCGGSQGDPRPKLDIERIDSEGLALLTNDSTWSAGNMRKIFERLENCHHRAFFYRWLAKIGINPTRHGWSGWLNTEITIPKEVLADLELSKARKLSAEAELKAFGSRLKRIGWFLLGQGDPNDWRLAKMNAEGIHYPPLTTRNRARMGKRERLLETQAKYADNLTIELDALATRVVFDESNRAIGVEYLKGAGLYQAHPEPNLNEVETGQVRASQEVILAGGGVQYAATANVVRDRSETRTPKVRHPGAR